MAGKAPKNREETWPVGPGEHAVTEFLSQNVGAQSPFGDDQEFPLPIEKILYEHPGPETRPNRAG
jgi:hypothetical protein